MLTVATSILLSPDEEALLLVSNDSIIMGSSIEPLWASIEYDENDEDDDILDDDNDDWENEEWEDDDADDTEYDW